MRITHVAWGHYPQWKGCGPVIYLHTLALAQREAGHEVEIVCASDRTVDGAPPYALFTEVVDGVPYTHVANRPVDMHDFFNPLREAHDPACAEAIAAALHASGPDVVHVHNLVGLSFDVISASRLVGAKVVVSLHNYLPLCSRDDLFFADAERCGGPHERSCSRCLGTMVDDGEYRRRHATAVAALNASDLNLAVSERVAEIYREHGVRADSIVVDRIGSATAERLWRRFGAARVSRAAAGAPRRTDPPLRLVFFGAQWPRKGLMVFLQAMRQLRHPERVLATLYCGLGAEHLERVRSFLASCEPEARAALRFEGSFTQDDLDLILDRADVAVLTPRWEDNGPQTVFEALAAGLPVIATRVGGIPDVVHDGVNGLLVDEGDVHGLAAAIDSLSGDPREVERLRAGLLPPISIAAHARALEEYYRSVTAPDGARTPSPRTAEVSTLDELVSVLAHAVGEPVDAELVLVDRGLDEMGARALAAVGGRVTLRRDRGAAPPADPTGPADWPCPGVPDLQSQLRWRSYAQLIDGSLRTLQVGCNHGFITAVIAERVADLSACELDPVAVLGAQARLEALGRPGVVCQADVCALPYADASYDQVIVADGLEHVPDDVGAVAELARVLRPGGRLIVNGPLPGYDVLFPREWIEHVGHVRDGYDREDLDALLAPFFAVRSWSENSRAAGVLASHSLTPNGPSLERDLERAWQTEDDPANEPYGFTALAVRLDPAATPAPAPTLVGGGRVV